jgi:hypothetical protein
MLHYGLGGNSGNTWAVDGLRAVVRHECDTSAFLMKPLLPQGLLGPQPKAGGAPRV